MLVPQYWAEAKTKKIVNGRQVTIKRFGWSDDSQSSAQQHAQDRVNEAMLLVESGEKIRKTEPKVPYNGAKGVPIREEIISRHGDSVITRNSYGALCINTPDVLFADIDIRKEPSGKLYWTAFVAYSIFSIVASVYMQSWPLFIAFLVLSIGIVPISTNILFNLVHLLLGNEEKIAMQRIRKFSKDHPNWHLRIYRTPNGYRVLVMHKTFNPNNSEALDILQKLHSDSIYIRMCKNQNCFRARVSPKPWRIGIPRLTPRPGVWPIKPERISERVNWVKKYEIAAMKYASCHFLEKLGSDRVDSKAKFICALHDKYSRSDADLKIA